MKRSSLTPAKVEALIIIKENKERLKIIYEDKELDKEDMQGYLVFQKVRMEVNVETQGNIFAADLEIIDDSDVVVLDSCSDTSEDEESNGGES